MRRHQKLLAQREFRMRYRVLLALANDPLVEELELAFKNTGFAVHCAESALSCITKLRQFTPDILVLDPNLLWGGCDGVLELVRTDNRWRLIPVVIISDHSSVDVPTKIPGSVIAELLPLPMPVASIVDRCSELVEDYRRECLLMSDDQGLTYRQPS